eukprot:scaffold770_cov255-Pinguiococcus_pyrenoidosus.AAC.22
MVLRAVQRPWRLGDPPWCLDRPSSPRGNCSDRACLRSASRSSVGPTARQAVEERALWTGN